MKKGKRMRKEKERKKVEKENEGKKIYPFPEPAREEMGFGGN